MEKQEKSGHLVLVMLPLQGHITPMLQLATILHSKGFSITIVHPDLNSPNPSNHPEFSFVPVPYRPTETGGDIASLLLSFNKNCAEPIQQCIKKIMHQKNSLFHVVGILYDTLMFFVQTIADDLKLPAINVRTSSAATLFLYPVVLPPFDGKDSVCGNEMPELQSLQLPQVRALLTQNSSDKTTELRIAMTNGTKSATALIVNTMDFLEQETLSKIKEYYPAPIFTIGPYHKLAPNVCSSLLKEDANCISWLNKQAQKSVIYVSFGSLTSIDEQELIETAWGLANSKQSFLWVVRPGLVRGSEWIEPMPNGFEEMVGERGCIVKWAPQKEVLAHAAVGGFWSHCGWNSTMESICEGVPMLCMPFFGDQHLNSNYICDVWKVGLKLQNNKLVRRDIEVSIKRLMVDTEGDEMREKAMELKEKASLCLHEEGSSYCSLNELTKQLLSVF